jgi:RNA polymerase sigma-70 factor (ECF subfamily)
MAEVALDYERVTDIELARLVGRRDPIAVRLVTRRNNQRLNRSSWSILKDRAEAEEAVQDGYLKGFRHIDSFAGESSLATWLTRIVINEALARRRTAERRAELLRERGVTRVEDYREMEMQISERPRSPEAEVMRTQVAKLLERAICGLPEIFRTVFMLREIEGLSVEETAEILQIPQETVKTRALRARRRLQRELDPELREALRGTFPFAGADCDGLTERVVTAFLRD